MFLGLGGEEIGSCFGNVAQWSLYFRKVSQTRCKVPFHGFKNMGSGFFQQWVLGMEIRMVNRMLRTGEIIGSYCIKWVRQEYNKQWGLTTHTSRVGSKTETGWTYLKTKMGQRVWWPKQDGRARWPTWIWQPIQLRGVGRAWWPRHVG